MCIAVAAQFVTGRNAVLEALICAAMAAATGLTSSTGWSAFGAAIGRLLSTPARLRLFNGAMAALVVTGVVWLLAE